MKCAIVTVGFGSYVPMGDRLAAAIQPYLGEAAFLRWKDLPPGCPPHKEKPYAFKAYALKDAVDHGAENILWLDSSIYPIASLTPLWEKIESEGYWIARNGWTNYQWTADSAYPELFTGLPAQVNARDINRSIPHVVATAFGLSVKHKTGAAILAEYYRMASATTIFCGPWRNTPETPCGPEDVLGHRHDQTALSFIAWVYHCKLTDCPEIFSYPPAHPDTILVADGGRVYG